MRSRMYSALVIVLAAALLTNGGPGRPSIAAQAPDAPIKLKAATFAPSRGQAPAVPPGLTVAGYAEGQPGYYLVQFRGPIEQAWKDQVAALGAELLDYVPEFAFKVRMSPAQARQAERLGSVAWVGLFHPAYKLSPDLVRDSTRLYRVRVERGADASLAAADVARAGAQVLKRDGSFLIVAADSAQLDAIARVLDVAWVENFVLHKKLNEYGGGVIMGANVANAPHATLSELSFDGSTQIIGVVDTGLGDGTSAGLPPGLGDRIAGWQDWTADGIPGCSTVVPDGPRDVDSGHGTHVAISALGAGDAAGRGRGTAPAARLFFQAVEEYVVYQGICALFNTDGYYLVAIPSDLGILYVEGYNAGARVYSNSWGTSAAGAYTSASASADSFIWNGHRDLAVVFAAGNDGADANGDGVIDPDSIGSPATAKNVLTVGASENDRQGHYECGTTYTTNGSSCSGWGGQNQVYPWSTWGYGGVLANDPSAGNKEQMAAFSSRGPTDDGRIKPDVVAPGTWVLSGYSSPYQQGYDPSPNPQNGAWQYDGWGFPLNQDYKYMGGTSMATPLVAGGAAVVRDYYQKVHNHGASAALAKATLINSAVDMLDENNDGANDNDFPIPNFHEGWGRVDLAAATRGTAQFVDDAAGVATNGSVTYQYTLGAGGQPFKVTLVWSDAPSAENVIPNLVNNLDLKVTAPSGAMYLGNVFDSTPGVGGPGGWSKTGGSADNTNNVENVYVQSAEAGTWTVEVKGFNVPNGPQPFALVVDGVFGTAPAATATPSPTPAATATATHTPSATATPTATAATTATASATPTAATTATASATPAGTSTPTPSSTPTATNTPLPADTPTATAPATTNTPTVTATPTAFISATPSPTAAPPAAPSNLAAVAASRSQIDLTWTDNASDESEFVVERSTNGNSFGEIASVGQNVTSYSDTGLRTNRTYYYRVRARNAYGYSSYSNVASARTLRR